MNHVLSIWKIKNMLLCFYAMDSSPINTGHTNRCVYKGVTILNKKNSVGVYTGVTTFNLKQC